VPFARRGLLLAGLCGLVVTGCSSSVVGSATGPASALQTAEAWFGALNHKDLRLAESYFTPARAGMTDWADGDTATWPTFSDLHCHQRAATASAADVLCTFTESAAPAVGNPDRFWSVDLHRVTTSRPWRIDNYGQG